MPKEEKSDVMQAEDDPDSVDTSVKVKDFMQLKDFNLQIK